MTNGYGDSHRNGTRLRRYPSQPAVGPLPFMWPRAATPSDGSRHTFINANNAIQCHRAASAAVAERQRDVEDIEAVEPPGFCKRSAAGSGSSS